MPAKPAPNVTRMTASVARASMSQILKRVRYGNEVIVVTKHGKDSSVFIPFERYERFKKMARELTFSHN